MLITFAAKNWRSFRDVAKLSMNAAPGRQNGKRLVRIDRHQMRILPAALIYGGNASGKTNFIRAIDFARRYILEDEAAFEPTDTFCTGTNEVAPTDFAFKVLIDNPTGNGIKDSIYEYRFSLTADEVVKEELIEVTKSGNKLLFRRHNGKLDLPGLWPDNKPEKQALERCFAKTSPKSLLLRVATDDIHLFKIIFAWFKGLVVTDADSLDSVPAELFNPKSSMLASVSKAISCLDVGITRLKMRQMSCESYGISKDLKARAQQSLDEGGTRQINNELAFIGKKDGELSVTTLTALHRNIRGRDGITFNINRESKSVQRLISLLAIFLSLIQRPGGVLVIDGLGQGLHPLLSLELLRFYLRNCGQVTYPQLLASTHESSLMRRELFRVDEIWLCERGSEGASELLSLCEYKNIHNETNIRSGYLQGQYGGTPIYSSTSLSDPLSPWS